MSNPITFPKLVAATALVASLVGCNDIERTPVHQAPIATPTPTPIPTPPPQPETILPPKPEVATVTKPEPPKPEPFVISDEDKKDPIKGAQRALDGGDRQAAMKLAQLAVRRTPKRSGAWNVLGRIQLQMGQKTDAIASFEKAVELNPQNSYAHNNLGLTLIYDKQFEEAVDELEQAVELEPVEAYMWNNLGMAYEHLDRLEEARNAYTQAIEMESGRARDSLARLKGVESVVRTAKVEPDKLIVPDKTDDKDHEKTDGEEVKETKTQ
jgi:Tfp pilus assembly protein PilF